MSSAWMVLDGCRMLPYSHIRIYANGRWTPFLWLKLYTFLVFNKSLWSLTLSDTSLVRFVSDSMTSASACRSHGLRSTGATSSLGFLVFRRLREAWIRWLCSRRDDELAGGIHQDSRFSGWSRLHRSSLEYRDLYQIIKVIRNLDKKVISNF